MALPPKTPPRFVPTLTEVVRAPDSAPSQAAAAAPSRTTVMHPSMLPEARPAANAVHQAARPAANAVHQAAQPPGSFVHGAHRPAVAPPRPAAPPGIVPAPARNAPAAGTVAPPVSVGAVSPVALTRPLPEGMEEYMVHRVMQRVDVVLDQRLREAIATVVQEQTRSVLPRLREEIESVVRHAVYEAVADELASGTPSVPKG
ncbi:MULTISPECIES: hypothetical protein [unclassified Acidovorax]|uniref:hypothetical protein n=1 Tax=unclassified Acidovorax TaxID=2684926 RepID=UPI001C448BFE|nr:MULTISPECIES: hypothetical protein [unclassified Acidovorax]MBV7426554.1 hypothetical protein [Acidovorax sp. sif0732]MBV7447679.1 hypothetical protein [Acidovorax sp. sif0715]